MAEDELSAVRRRLPEGTRVQETVIGFPRVSAERVGRGQDMDHGARDKMLGRLAEAVGPVTVTHPTRVAIDGPPAAGKTTLADELAVVLRAQGREVIRATIEGFLFPRAQRYRRGEYSPEGCYFDNHDY